MKNLENLEIPPIGESTLELVEVFDSIEENPLCCHAKIVRSGYCDVRCIRCGSRLPYGNVHPICHDCM